MTENRATWSGLLRRPDSDIGEVQHVVVRGGEDEARKAFAENWPEYEVVRVQRMRLGSRPLIKPDPTSPEIDELIEGSWRGRSGQRDAVHLSDAIQAVRDTEARVRHHYALSGRALREVGEAVRNSTLTDTQKVDVIAGVLANGPLDDAPGGPCEGAVFAARREAFREAVEALRDQADMLDPSDCLPPEDHYPTFRGWQGAAQFIERTFLSPDNPEGSPVCSSGGDGIEPNTSDNPEGNA